MARLLCFLILLAGLVLSGDALTAAQGVLPDAWTQNALNMRTGPGMDYEIIVILPPDTGLLLDGRNSDQSWMLGRTENGVFRGWVSARYLRLRDGFDPGLLPVSDEIITQLAAPGVGGPPMAVVSAWARADLEVRVGPGTQTPLVAQLAPTRGLVIEGRNGDGSWVLAHTEGGAVRGWTHRQELFLREDLIVMRLPVLTEIMPLPLPTLTPLPTAIPPTAAPAPTQVPSGGRVNTQGHKLAYNHNRVSAINLSAYPVIPASLGQARAIYAKGQAMGRDPHVMAKVGDCASAAENFLSPFGHGNYNLGGYGSLQGALGWFSASLAYGSTAASPGFVAGAVLDATWANPAICQPGESPLLCEYRTHRSSVAIIMFGTQDVFLMTPEQYDGYMRQIVYETIQAGVIPVLSTFPSHLAHWDNTILYNQIVVQIALDYNIPLINLWLALEGLPNHGLAEDGNHLSNPMTQAGDLTDPNLQTGFTLRNLVTLQALDVVWRGAMY